MSQPVSKRRRLSDNTRNDDPPPRSFPKSAPTTPRRASYLSPTKSSLQRSHPHLVTRATRASTQLQGHRLLQHVLGGATDEDLQVSKAPTQPAAVAPGQTPTTELNGVPEEANASAPSPSQSQSKLALQRRKQHTRSLSRRIEDEQSSGYPMLPRLVKGSQNRRRQFSLSPDEGDHALPPTPVQLGRDLPPERPRGLASSSPRGSKSGSGRNRIRQRGSQVINSSPLKPKSRMIMAKETAELERQAQATDNSPPSDINEGDIAHDADAGEIPALIQQRELVLKELQASTRKLFTRNRELEKALAHNDVLKMLKNESAFRDVINTASIKRTPEEPLFGLKPVASEPARQALHLNLFAPGGLQLSSTTRTGLDNSHATVIHTIRANAPPPCPPHTLDVTFEVTTHPEDLTVHNIIYLAAASRHNLGQDLHRWINSRLTNDIVRTDLAGLVWGVGKYFEAAVERAKVFHRLDQKYGDGQHSALDSNIDVHDKLGIDQALASSPYISTSSLAFPIQSQHQAVAKGKFLASWQICLTPTSEARHECEILLSGVTEQMAVAGTGLFGKLWRLEGFERSVEAVLDMLDGKDDVQAAPQKRKRRKFA